MLKVPPQEFNEQDTYNAQWSRSLMDEIVLESWDYESAGLLGC